MNEILYYPGFQINNEEWLKFALLYLKDVNTIVPPEADDYLSDTHRYLLGTTDLLNSYRPTYEEIRKSTEDAVWAISRDLENPVKMFGVLGPINIIDYWRQPQNHNFELFQSKFSYQFEEFCRDYGFASFSANGIRIPYQLGIIYMSILAHNIGDYNDMAVITDLEDARKLRSINDKMWKYNKRFEEIKVIKKLISLEIPCGLQDIPLREIVKLRNKNGFQKKLKAFQAAVNELTSIPNNNFTEQSIYEIKRNISFAKESLKSEIVDIGLALSTTILGVHLVFSNNGSDLELLKEMLGLGAIANGIPQVYDKLHRNWDRSLATRYLTDIKNLDRSQAGLRRNLSNIF
ncbi:MULTISPECIES: hypothetical protein [Bacillus cereus group]|uniref:hypothetical protein n=1 Tax=Bacillus cereus group TaxID=86661 RepID=UPI0030F47508